MVYEYEERNRGVILAGTLFDDGDIEKQPAFEELEEVYAKAKILNKITNIVKTGRSLEDFGDAEVTLLAIEHELNYILEDK